MPFVQTQGLDLEVRLLYGLIYCHLVLIDCIKFASCMSMKFELYILGNGHV
jgi:hypothetical protein